MKRVLYLILGGMLLATSCSSGSDGGEDEPEKPENPKNVTLELSCNDLVFEAVGGEKTFTVSCNGNWSIENGSGWCKTDFSSGTGNLTVKVAVDEYSGLEDRNTNLTVKAGDKTQVLGVTQKCKDAIVLSKDKFDVPHAGETISVEVKSNITYDVSVPAEFQSWISSAPDTRSVTTTNYNFTIAKNEGRQMRAGYIVFSGNSVRDTIRVYQTDRLILTADTCYVSHAGEEITVELQTNIDYEVWYSTNGMLNFIETRALRTDKLHFSVSENGNRSVREAVIIVKDKNSDLSDTLCVYQYGRGLVLSERDYTVGMAGDTIAVKVKGGINYDVKIPSDFQSWIVPIGNSSASSRAAAPRMYAFSILKTENTESREGYIVFSGNSLTDTVYISQMPDYLTEVVAGVEFEMVFVKGGTFRMGATSEQGSSDPYNDEYPVHSVTLSDYYIGKFEVTQGLWKAVIGNTPSYFKKGDDYPVENITWTDAQTFCTRLSQLTGKKYALPTEAQWEYAARGGNKSKGYKYSGSNTIDNVAWYSSNSSSNTHPVGTRLPNELGIYDMSGNVWEWCSDWYSSNYYSISLEVNPTGPYAGSNRVLRGGSWSFNAGYGSARCCRVSYRSFYDPSGRYSNLGFRIVLLP
ncbi:MAG: SUMF1/EgtB/PvdO family nonheme iron enzyme [Oscillibacter sp.]|nr:SUMF1/EgtB/PvdO family nonheme iron enzyme [Oscillibacter sp.]